MRSFKGKYLHHSDGQTGTVSVLRLEMFTCWCKKYNFAHLLKWNFSTRIHDRVVSVGMSQQNETVGVRGGSVPGILPGGTSSVGGAALHGSTALLSPVEGLGEEAGGRAQPAPVGIALGRGAGDGPVHLPLGAVLLLWEVVWDGRVLLHLHSGWVQWDENLRQPDEEVWHSAFTPKTLFFLSISPQKYSTLPRLLPRSSPPVGLTAP